MRIRLRATTAIKSGTRLGAIGACAVLFIAASAAVNSLRAHEDQLASWIPPHQMERDGTQSRSGGRSLSGFRDHVEAGAIVVRRSAPTSCLPGDLKSVLTEVAARFGDVSVQSTHRSPGRNRRAGGAAGSLHLDCRAIDFRVDAPGREVLAFLREHPDIGGLKQYRNGLIHIDNGAPRTW